MWTCIPTTTSDLFGLEHVGANYSLCLPVVILGSVLFSTLLAPSVYSKYADDDGCTGADCFGEAFLCTALATLFGTAFAAALSHRVTNLYQLR